MARIRTIKPEFPQSESMGRVSREARLLFIMLWTIVDDAGRTRAASRMLASVLYPYDDDAKKHIGAWLAELEKENCVRLYEVDGASYLQIENWLSHQKIDKPSKSRLPEPPSRTFANPREGSAIPREPSSADLGPRTMEGTMDHGRDHVCAAPLALAPSVVSLPTNRFKASGEEIGFSQSQLDDYAQTYPAVDVPQQFREMRRWLMDNPERRKTAKGMGKFVNGWLGKEQDKGNGRRDNRRTAHENFALGAFAAAGGDLDAA